MIENPTSTIEKYIQNQNIVLWIWFMYDLIDTNTATPTIQI